MKAVKVCGNWIGVNWMDPAFAGPELGSVLWAASAVARMCCARRKGRGTIGQTKGVGKDLALLAHLAALQEIAGDLQGFEEGPRGPSGRVANSEFGMRKSEWRGNKCGLICE